MAQAGKRRDAGPGGRRRGPTRTREQILDAAREQFAALGYGGATIRGIAGRAGVDPALIHHFFGSKDDLFAAALPLPAELISAVPALLAEGLDGAGVRLVRHYLGLWEDATTRRAMLAMVRSSVGHEEAGHLLREFIAARLLPRTAALLPAPAELRMTLAMSSLSGLALGRYVLEVPALRDADLEVLVASVGPSVQRYLTGDLGAEH